MKKSILFLSILFLALTVSGCSKIRENLRARLDLFRAEQTFWKAEQLKHHKVSFEQRKPIYDEACTLYVKALDRAPGIFNSGKLEEARTSCFNAERFEWVKKLEDFSSAYCKKHLKECEYGFIQGGVEI